LYGLLKTYPLLAGRGGSQATAIPIAEFKELSAQVVAEFNATPGRSGFGCNGRSYDEIFAESYAKSKVRKPSKELHRRLLCDQEVATVSHGTVRINAGKGDSKHRYCLNFHTIEHGEKVAVVFNPKNLSEQVEIYDLEGRILGTADWMPVVAYNDKDAAREHAGLRAQRNKAVKTAAKLTTRMSKLEYQQLNATVPHPLAQLRPGQSKG
jgi:hypothetical protein